MMKQLAQMIFLILALALWAGCRQSSQLQSQPGAPGQAVSLDLKIGTTTKEAVLKKLGPPSDSRTLQGDDGLFEYLTYQLESSDRAMEVRLISQDRAAQRKTVTRLALQFLNGVLWNASL